MVSPQIEDGYTQFANDIVEAMARLVLNSGESRCLWFIWRKTYGWHKKVDRLSLSQFTEATGMSAGHVCEALASLKKRNVVEVRQDGHSKAYGFQKDYSLWDAKGKQGRRGENNACFLPKSQTSVNREGSLNREGQASVNREQNLSVNRETQKKRKKVLKQKETPGCIATNLKPSSQEIHTYMVEVAIALGYEPEKYGRYKWAHKQAKDAILARHDLAEMVGCAKWMMEVDKPFLSKQTVKLALVAERLLPYEQALKEGWKPGDGPKKGQNSGNNGRDGSRTRETRNLPPLEGDTRDYFKGGTEAEEWGKDYRRRKAEALAAGVPFVP